jgi:Tfp pilus assembly protein PilP
MVWDELKTRRPKNIMPEEKKKYAAAVFEVCAKHDVKNFSGLYFGLNEGKIESVEDFILNYDDKVLYKIL